MSNISKIIPVALLSLGSLSLSALLLTVNTCESVSRHPVFVNFLRTWLLWTCYMLYVYTAALATPAFEDDKNITVFQAGLQDMLWMSTQVSTLNLILHTWVKMKIWRSRRSAQKEKARTLILVVTPYLSGLVAVIEFFPLPTRRISDNRALPSDVVMACLFLAVTIINLLWNVVLVATFWRDRRILRQANVHGVMSLSMLRRLLVVCFYQLAMTIFSGVFLLVPMEIPKDPIPIAKSIYPLLVFFSMGLRQDIMHAWFPCWVAQACRTPVLTHELDFNLSVTDASTGDESQRSGRLGHQLEEKVVNTGLEPRSATVKPEDAQYTNNHEIHDFRL